MKKLQKIVRIISSKLKRIGISDHILVLRNDSGIEIFTQGDHGFILFASKALDAEVMKTILRMK